MLEGCGEFEHIEIENTQAFRLSVSKYTVGACACVDVLPTTVRTD